MDHNDYYVILLGSRMENGQELNKIVESGPMATASAMTAWAAEKTDGFWGDEITFRVCRNNQSIDMEDLTYNYKSGTFSREECHYDINGFYNYYKKIEMTAAETAEYIERHIKKEEARKNHDD